MRIHDFYDIFDNELEKIIERYQEDSHLRKLKQENQRKGYALLIWFLEFYGKTPSFKKYITDGNSDASCDIIFDSVDITGERNFYVIQSKWKNKNNCVKKLESTEFKQALSDFELILRDDKPATDNQLFNENYAKLIEHLQLNGKTKFIYLTLAEYNLAIEDNVRSFRKCYGPNIELEIYDINKIRRDFIEFNFKGIKPQNPLEYRYNPEESKIRLLIERFGEKVDRDFIDYNGPSRSFIFIVKPKTIFELFDRYGFSLFFKNIRNPLEKSNFNQEIANTLKTRPGLFWYFNNGVTAITKLIPEIGIQAKEIELLGLQIINGTQTVYTIYETYKKASAIERAIMDGEARITFRLIKSSDEKLSFEITKFTNSQNEIYDADFMSNDEVQTRLQEESFKTRVWYKRRRGEFTISDEFAVKNRLSIVPNDLFALVYVTFHLQEPIMTIKEKDYFFISHKQSEKGMYEKIFNDRTRYEDMLASFYMFKFALYMVQPTLSDGKDEYQYEYSKNEKLRENVVSINSIIAIFMLPPLALAKTVLKQYLHHKYGNFSEKNISTYIILAIENEEVEKITQLKNIFNLAYGKLFYNPESNVQDLDSPEVFETINRLLNSKTYFELIKEKLLERELTIEEIRSIEDMESSPQIQGVHSYSSGMISSIK